MFVHRAEWGFGIGSFPFTAKPAVGTTERGRLLRDYGDPLGSEEIKFLPRSCFGSSAKGDKQIKCTGRYTAHTQAAEDSLYRTQACRCVFRLIYTCCPNLSHPTSVLKLL